jgi:hypothetical protein
MPIPLYERSERENARRIRRKVKALRGVVDCNEISMSFTREKPRIQLHVTLKEHSGYEETHAICSAIDRQVRHMAPGAHVTIRSETSGLKDNGEAVLKIVKGILEGQPGSRGAQNIHLIALDGKIGVDLILLWTYTRAAPSRSCAAEMEVTKKLKAADPRISEVVIHKESLSELVLAERSGHGTEARCYIEHVANRFPDLRLLGPPVIRIIGDQLHVRIRVVPSASIGQERRNEISSKLSAAIKNGYHAITKVVIIGGPGDGALGVM